MKYLPILLLLVVVLTISSTTGKHHHKKKQSWQVQPGVNRDEKGNVIGGVEVKNKGPQHELEAGWNKVFKGPNKAKPSWHIGGTWKFRRSIEQPSEVHSDITNGKGSDFSNQ